MNVNKRDQLKLPKRKKPEIVLSASAEIFLPTFHTLNAEFQHAKRHERGIIRDDNSEFLHQYRVALRRCRALISLLKSLFFPQQKAMLNNEFKTMMQKTNRLRDLDVFLYKMDDYFSCLEHSHHQGLTCFIDELQDARRKAYKDTKKWLKTDNYEQQCLLVQGLLAEMEANQTEEGHSASKVFGYEIIQQHFQGTLTLCHRLDNQSTDNVIHRLRIRCKKLRYLLEYFSPILPPQSSKEQIKCMKQLQDELGDFNDLSIQLQFLSYYLKDKKTTTRRYKAASQLKSITQQRHGESKLQVIKQVELFSTQEKVITFQSVYKIDKLTQG
ncbi:CHAD domain-containing protein [Photobacterium chitinilyticum]|uniref:CHAD domain-containing protein n=1 Tax=Photobacterium chitinilyticum TaxID=2485123 RepID=A0A444JNC0_9GAMM|nr:CHAD domain-containing protein [Photobacterium chitinilyticum]RWX54600.1 CHAD domain-containing protein [Photobacterium chitinilyticum]